MNAVLVTFYILCTAPAGFPVNRGQFCHPVRYTSKAACAAATTSVFGAKPTECVERQTYAVPGELP